MGRPTELTKQYLIDHGISNITKDGHVFRKDGSEVHYCIASKKSRYDTQQYKVFYLYDHDLYEQRKEKFPHAGQRSVLLSRAVYAWYNLIAPANYDIDHINNDSLDDRLENLQLLTRAENLAKRKGHMNQYASSLVKDE